MGGLLPLCGVCHAGGAVTDLSPYLPKVRIAARVCWNRWRTIIAPYMEFDDLYHNGVVGMMGARQRWRSDRGASFWTFAAHSVGAAMLDRIREDPSIPMERKDRMGRKLKLEPLDESVLASYETTLHETMLATLEGPEFRAMYMYWYEGMNYCEIANALRISEGAAQLICHRALEKLKEQST